MRIHHVATLADWRAARRRGTYTTSTLGRTLEQEGFVHAARPEQVARVYDTYYREHHRRTGEPLVLLTIDTDRLDRLGVRWQEDPVGSGSGPGEPADTYPHVYGAVPRRAVTAVLPLDAAGRPPSFLSVFLREALPPIGVAVAVMALAGLGGTAAGAALGPTATLPVVLLLLVLGGVLGWLLLRRLRP